MKKISKHLSVYIVISHFWLSGCSSPIASIGYLENMDSGHHSKEVYHNDEYELHLYFPNVYYPKLMDNASINTLNNDYFRDKLSTLVGSNEDIIVISQYHDSTRLFFFLEKIKPRLTKIAVDHLTQLGYSDIDIQDTSTNYIFAKKIDENKVGLISERTMVNKYGNFRFVLIGGIDKNPSKISKEYFEFETSILKKQIEFIYGFKLDSTNLNSHLYTQNTLFAYLKESGYNYPKTLRRVSVAANDTLLESKDFCLTKALCYSFLSQNDSLRVYSICQNGKSKSSISTICKEAIYINYHDSLTSIAGSTRVLVYNEGHHWNVHRQIVTNELKLLRSLGYRYLALEALSPYDTLINSRGYPLQKSGQYFADPAMARLARAAIGFGFTLVNYEATDYNMREVAIESRSEYRERRQAENIASKLTISDTSKLLILCGPGHASISDKHKMMANRLSKILDEKIISIDQTNATTFEKEIMNHCSNCSEQDYLISSPTINEEGFTYALIRNAPDDYENCPKWARTVGNNKVSIHDSYTKITSNDYVFIYDKSEKFVDDSARVPIIACKGDFDCFLGDSSYFILITDQEGKTLHSSTIDL